MSDLTTLLGQAEILRAARKAARMSQRHLAEAAGVSDRTVRRAEAGLPITGEVVRALCAVLGLNATLLNDPGPTTAPITSRRLIPDYELGPRFFIWSVTKPVGGISPFLMPALVCLLVDLRPVTMTVVALLAACLYDFSRHAGATRRQAMDFLRGRAFVDGEPIDLVARKQEILAAAGA